MNRTVETLTWVAQQDPHDLARLLKHSRSDGCLVLVALAAECNHPIGPIALRVALDTLRILDPRQ
jgi:hypothetical protein